MSIDDSWLVGRLHEVADSFDMPFAPPADDLRRGRALVRRRQGVMIGTVAAAVALVLGVTAAVARHDRAQTEPPPADPPGQVVGAVPVWWDALGLHRGDVVEQTPIKILDVPVGDGQVTSAEGALALVRTGAVYLDPHNGDVWFHPWGGEPRIVGRGSEAGPGGDPAGDTAAWFEGTTLVVYDTRSGREIHRIDGEVPVSWKGGDHYPPGNYFLEVTAERVVWVAFDDVGIWTRSLDVAAGTVTELARAGTGRHVVDVAGDVRATSDSELHGLALRVAGRAAKDVSAMGSHVRLSPGGDYLLGVEEKAKRHGAVVLDTRSGELWRIPDGGYPWIAWSYGDIAVVDTERSVVACDAGRRTCRTLPAQEPVLLPTS